MSNDTLKNVHKPEETLKDPLTELLRNGARELIRRECSSNCVTPIIILNPNGVYHQKISAIGTQLPPNYA